MEEIIILPNDKELEKVILGSLLVSFNDSECIRAMELLIPEHFYELNHQVIYKTILLCIKKYKTLDAIVIKKELEFINEYANIGGPVYIQSLVSRVAGVKNIVMHSLILIEHYTARSLYQIGNNISRLIYTDNALKILDYTKEEVSKLYDIFKFRESQFAKNIAIEVSNDLNKAVPDVSFIETEFASLNDIIVGWEPSSLYIIAARPGMGKTALALQIAYHAAKKELPVAVFTLEMSSAQLVTRLISSESGINSTNIKKRNLSAAEKITISKTAHLIKDNIIVDDSTGLNVSILSSKARGLKDKYGIELLVLDYLQLMEPEYKKSGGNNREQDVSEMSKALKRLAKDLKIPVIALSQLSRDVEKRSGVKRPQLSDLRESGSIEQDADCVIFIYRPDYYNLQKDGSIPDGGTELIIAKQRNGSTGTAKLIFIPEQTKFINIENDEVINNNQQDLIF